MLPFVIAIFRRSAKRGYTIVSATPPPYVVHGAVTVMVANEYHTKHMNENSESVFEWVYYNRNTMKTSLEWAKYGGKFGNLSQDAFDNVTPMKFHEWVNVANIYFAATKHEPLSLYKEINVPKSSLAATSEFKATIKKYILEDSPTARKMKSPAAKDDFMNILDKTNAYNTPVLVRYIYGLLYSWSKLQGALSEQEVSSVHVHVDRLCDNYEQEWSERNALEMTAKNIKDKNDPIIQHNNMLIMQMQTTQLYVTALTASIETHFRESLDRQLVCDYL